MSTPSRASGPKAEEPPLPSICAWAEAKRARADRLAADGFARRANRLLEQVESTCPAERDRARAQESKNLEQAAAATKGRGGSGEALWSASVTARSAQDLPLARRLASLAAVSFQKQGQAVGVWSGVADLLPLALSRDGSLLLGATPEDELVVLDAKKLEPRAFLDLAPSDPSRHSRRAGGVFSPDGATVGLLDEGGVVLFDATTGARGRRLSWADQPIETFAFTNDGASVIVGARADFDAIVRRFDVRTGDSSAEYRVPNVRGVSALAVSPADGSIAIGGRDGSVELLDGKKLTQTKTIAKGKLASLVALSFSPSGDRLATISTATSLEVWNVKDGKRITQAALERPWGEAVLAFSSDGSRVRVSGGTWGDALVDIDAASGQALRSKKLAQSLGVMSADAGVVVSGRAGDGLAVVDAKSGDTLAEAWRSSIRVEDLALAPGALAVAREIRSGIDSQIEIFLVSARSAGARFLQTPGYKATLAFSPLGQRLAGSFGGRGVRLWDVASARSVEIPEFKDWVDRVSFEGPDVLRAAGGPFKLEVASLRVGASEWTHELTLGDSHGSRGFALSGRFLAESGESGVSVIDLRAPDSKQTYPLKGAHAVTLSADEKYLFVVSDHGTERIALGGSKTRTLLSGHCQAGPASVSRDGTLVLVGCAYRELALLGPGGPVSVPWEVDRAKLSPDGAVVVTERNGVITVSGRNLEKKAVLALRGAGVAIARAPSGEVELFGGPPALGDRLFCRVGLRAYPFELCEDLLYADDLFEDALVTQSLQQITPP